MKCPSDDTLVITKSTQDFRDASSEFFDANPNRGLAAQTYGRRWVGGPSKRSSRLRPRRRLLLAVQFRCRLREHSSVPLVHLVPAAQARSSLCCARLREHASGSGGAGLRTVPVASQSITTHPEMQTQDVLRVARPPLPRPKQL
eukprot:4916866-Amphidinium_carterae.2